MSVAALVSLPSCRQQKCGTGTREQDGQCVVDGAAVCAAGTTLDVGSGTCVTSASSCGAGQVLMNGACTPSASNCSAGTEFDVGRGKCVPSSGSCGAGTVLMNGSCVVDGSTLCGADTTFDAATGSCVAAATACGLGTVFVDGGCLTEASVCGPNASFEASSRTCVVASGACQRGTSLAMGRCVPNGAIVCAQGLRFEVDGGTCVIDPSACAMGTVLVRGVCVTEDSTLRGDLTESGETNDTWSPDGGVPAGLVTLTPDASVVLSGCITPRFAPNGVEPGTADVDDWKLSVSAPTVVEVTADGVGGLMAAFRITNAALPGFNRIGMGVTSDTARRQVYLPAAGDYHLVMSDVRTLLTGQVVGTAQSCYFTTLKTVALPAATPLTNATVAATYSGAVQVFSRTPATPEERLVLRTYADTVVLPGFTLVQGARFSLSSPWRDYTRAGLGQLTPAAPLLVIVDPVQLAGPSPWPMQFAWATTTVAPFAASDAGLTVAKLMASNGEDAMMTATPLYIDLATPGTYQWSSTMTEIDGGAFETPGSTMVVREGFFGPSSDGLDVLAQLQSFSFGSSAPIVGQVMRITKPGRSYALFGDSQTQLSRHTQFRVAASLQPFPEVTLTPGAAATLTLTRTQADVPTALATATLTDPKWVEFVVANETGLSNSTFLELAVFDPATDGVLGPATQLARWSANLPLSAPVSFRRIYVNETRSISAQVTASSPNSSTATVSLTVREDGSVVDLGTAVLGTPLTRTVSAVPVGGSKRVLVRVPAGADVQVTATPSDSTANISLSTLSRTEAVLRLVDAAPAGAAEVALFRGGAFPDKFIALLVRNVAGANATDVNVTVEATPPGGTYALSNVLRAFDDACDGGTRLGLSTITDGGSFLQNTFLPTSGSLTTPAGFRFFGQPVSSFRVSSNGFLHFSPTDPPCGACSSPNFSGTGPTNLVAAAWSAWSSQVCVKTETSRTTVQWVGVGSTATSAIQAQVRLNADGGIEFIYGRGHTSPTAGVKSPNGVTSQTFSISAGGAYLLTP